MTPFDRLASEAATYGKLMRRAPNGSERKASRSDSVADLARSSTGMQAGNDQLQ
jgi:hypothetical protein